MARTVVHVQDNVSGPPSLVLELPRTVDDAGKAFPTTWTLATTPEKLSDLENSLPAAVQAAGRFLYDIISIKPFAEAMTLAFETRIRDHSPIYFKLDLPEIDAWPWECLHHPKTGFLALDGRLPIARQKQPKDDNSPQPYLIVGKVRVLAILSAPGPGGTNVSARRELATLYQQLKNSGIDYHLQVLTCEKDLERVIRGLGDDSISYKPITGYSQLLAAVKDSKANIVHVFCHAKAEDQTVLQFGTVANWDAGQLGSIPLVARELYDDVVAADRAMLLILNCCESAMKSRDSCDLASSLVYHGFPAVIGMRESVDARYARLFTGEFYREALQLIRRAREAGKPTIVEWAHALCKARRAVCADLSSPQDFTVGAPNFKEWTIPILYTRPEPIQIHWLDDPAQLRALSEYNALKAAKELILLYSGVNLGETLQKINAKIDRLGADLFPPDAAEDRPDEALVRRS